MITVAYQEVDYTELLVGLLVGGVVMLTSRRRRRTPGGRRTPGAPDDTLIRERRRIARELHDGVGHGLLVIAMHSRSLSVQSPRDRPTARAIDETVHHTLTEMRRMVGVLRAVPAPSRMPRRPLSGQVADLINRLPRRALTVDLQIAGLERDLDPAVRHAALRLVQEGLTNAMKHAGGSPVHVIVEYGTGVVVTVLTGDARELHAVPEVMERPLHGSGLTGLCERLTDLGGSFDCGPVAGGRGFLLKGTLPDRPSVIAAASPKEEPTCPVTYAS
ncbi:hypothetical protein SUDANB151_04655 [Streptomyces sp. enrichment culture]